MKEYNSIIIETCVKNESALVLLGAFLETCQKGKEEVWMRAKEQGKRRLKQKSKDGRKGGRQIENRKQEKGRIGQQTRRPKKYKEWWKRGGEKGKRWLS